MKKIFLTFYLLISIGFLYSQNLNVFTQISYPFPTALGEIEENANIYTVSISNNSNTARSYYLIVDLIGDNGISITTDRFYKPTEPIIINANSASSYTFEEIFDFNGGFDTEYLVFDGISRTQLLFQNTLPEGNYQICVYAFDFEEESQIGEGCSITFPVGNENVPIINTPFDFEELIENENYNFLISWETPITNPRLLSNIEYELKIIDLTEAYDDDLEELFSDSGASILFETQLDQRSYFYNTDGSDPPLISGHEYGIRVRAYDIEGDLFFENNGYSEIKRFSYGEYSDEPEASDSTIIVTRELPEDCESRCNIVELEDTSIVSSIANFDTLMIGYFKMVDMDFTKTGNMFSGTAKIIVDFLHNMKINVNVTAIKINNSGHIIFGSVRAVQDAAESFGDLAEFVNFGRYDSQIENIAGNFPKTKYDPYLSYLNTSRSLAALLGTNSTGLPISIKDSIKGNKFLIGVTDLLLRPNSAIAKIVVGTKLAIFDGENALILVADSVCIHPAGFGGQYNIALKENLVFPFQGNDKYNLVLNGNSGENDNYCKVNFDCAGVSSFDIAGEIHFPKDVIRPIRGDSILDKKAKAYFNFSLAVVDSTSTESTDSVSNVVTSNHINWIADVRMDKFSINKLKGWTFEMTKAYWDMSDIKNPKEIEFPEEYHTTTPDYRGFYLKEAIITPPKNLFASGGSSETSGISTATIKNLFIDPNIYGKLEAVNILPIEKGRLDGWGFSIDSLNLEYYDGQLEIGIMKGVMQMPLLKETDTLEYTALIFDTNIDVYEDSTSNQNADLFYAFGVVPQDTVTFPFLLANGTLYDDSYFEVGFQPTSEEQAYIRAVLHGELTVDSDRHYPSGKPVIPAYINLPGLEYKFDYTSGENGGFNSDSTYISFASPQKKVGGFLVSLDDFDVGISTVDHNIAVDFDLAIGIGKGNVGIQAASSFKLKSNFSTSNLSNGSSGMTQGLKTLNIDQVLFDSVSIGLDMEKFKMHGSAYWYNDELEENNSESEGETARNKGVKGDLTIELPVAGIKGKFAAGFGTYGTPPIIEEGVPIDYDSTFYSYWFVDGALMFNSGINFCPGLAIYGLGGGVAYNMIRTDSIIAIDTTNLNQGVNVFEPQYNAFNMKLLGIIGTTPSPNAFNADISLSAQIVDGGIDMLSINGDGYIATPLNDRSNPTIWADVGMNMFLPNDDRAFTMDGHLNVAMNLDSTLYGNLPNSDMDYQLVAGRFHASQESWYFYLGEPDMTPGIGDDPRGSATLSLGENFNVDMKTYMMVGHGIPTELPPLPPEIENILNNPSGELAESTTTNKNNGSLGGVDYSTGKGFAHGSYASIEAKIDAKIIYANLNAYLGYDMNLTQDLTQYCSSTGQLRGINGWYAQGQAYAGIKGGMGLRFKLFGTQREFHIMELAAAIALTGGGPKPFYFGGRASIHYELLGGKIKGNSSFKFSVGERCSPMSSNPFAGLNIIENIDPVDNASEIFVGKNMSVKFALPMDKPLYVPIPIYDANNEIERVEEQSFTPKFTLEFTDENNNSIQTKAITWADDSNHEQLFMLPTKMLKPNKTYKLKITVKAIDNTHNRWMTDASTGQIWKLDTLIEFTTGQYPKNFKPFVSYNVPLSFERYYLQDISHGGRIYLTSDLDQNFYFPTSITGMKGTFSYFIRFTNLETQKNIEVPFTYVNYANSEPQLRFTVPRLDNESIYALQVIRKGTNAYKGTVTEFSKGKKQTTIASVNEVDISTEITLTNDKISPGKQTANNEDLLFYTYFRTSKFNTLKEKVNAITITNTEYIGSENNRKLKINMTLDEPFEKRDFKPFVPLNSNINNMTFEPKVKMRDPFDSNYHNNKAKTKIWGFIKDYNENVKGGLTQWNIPDNLRIDWGIYTNFWLNPNRFHSTLSNPLSESEVENLWNNYLSTGQMNNSSFNSTSTIGGMNVNILSNSNAYIIYDTHYNIHKDKINLKNWVLNYYSSICGPQPCIVFLNQHPSFNNKYTVMKNTNFRINANTGSYKLSFYPNGSDKPGEYFPNIFKGVNVNFSTPKISFGQMGNN